MQNRRAIITRILFFLIAVSLTCYGFLGPGAGRSKASSIGYQFHRDTSLGWSAIVKDLFQTKPERPPQYKTYRNTPVIKLPEPDHQGMTVEEAIRKRRSIRNYSREKMSLSQVSQLLFAAQGVTGKIYDIPLRTAPSAGALYPFEIYLVVNNVQDLSQGIYHFNVLSHALELIKPGDFRSQVTEAGLQQDMLGKADVTFILSAIFDRVRHKYGERGVRYVYMEAGHISQNISLQAVSLGLGSVGVGAFYDKKVNTLIGVDGRQEAVIYLHAVGTR
jgi:SagB-type dehydrogenase family enzyme